MLKQLTILTLSLLLFATTAQPACEANNGERSESIEIALGEFVHGKTSISVPAPKASSTEITRRQYFSLKPTVRTIVQIGRIPDIVIRTRRLLI